MEKYFDWQHMKPLSPSDGCPLGQWMSSGAGDPFAVHPKGFKIFLPPGEVDLSDEYRAGDPYEVALNSPFHARRMACTNRMVGAALAGCGSAPRLLDIGCGAGHLTAELLKAFPQVEASALDYSVSAISAAVDLYPGIDFIAGNAYSLPYTKGYFDVVVCNNIWEHVPDPLRMLASIRQALRPGGFLIISTPSRYRFENLLRLVRGRPLEFNSKLHVTEYSVGQVHEQLRFGKFDVVEYYSEPIVRKQSSLRKRLVYALLLPSLRTLFRLYGRHHDLESTVFFLARNMP